MSVRKQRWPKLPRTDGRLVLLIIAAALLLAGRAWLAENPQHNPWAPLDLDDPRGLATGAKLAALRGDMPACHAVLERRDIAFTALPATQDGECRREDRLSLAELPLFPAEPQMTCPIAAGLILWVEKDVQRLAQEHFGARVRRIEQLGTYSCRRQYGAETGRWSEHATGNAIDIAAFVFEDGRRISVLQEWDSPDGGGQFLRAVRNAACESFGTVLSPEYNAAHADHFHFDQARVPGRGACR